MIYTVTFNPSLDYVVTVRHFIEGIVNRTGEERIVPGGKGINVSMALKNLGYESTALGFLAGFTGRELQRLLEEKGIATDFITVAEGLSRINVKIRSEQESEINGAGPVIRPEDLAGLYERLDALQAGDILVLAGSVPGTMPVSVYGDMLKRLQKRDLKLVVDAAGNLLDKVLQYRPFLIKPNHHELGELFGVTISGKEEAAVYAGKLQERGARNVLVSMAGEGAVLVAEDGRIYRAKAPKGRVRNSVGAGDSMVAGFLAGYLEKGDYADAFRMGVCTGSASAFSDGLATREEVEKLLQKGDIWE